MPKRDVLAGIKALGPLILRSLDWAVYLISRLFEVVITLLFILITLLIGSLFVGVVLIWVLNMITPDLKLSYSWATLVAALALIFPGVKKLYKGNSDE